MDIRAHRLRQVAAWGSENRSSRAAAGTGSLNASPWMHSVVIAWEHLFGSS